MSQGVIRKSWIQSSRQWLPLVFAFLCLSFTGCVFLAELIGIGPQKPRVEVKSLEVHGMTLTELDLKIGLTIENPNDFDISLKTVRYGLEANNRPIASGRITEAVKVLAKARSDVAVPVRIRIKEAQELAASIMAGAKSVKTVLSGAAVFDTPVGTWELPFRQEQDLVSP